MTRRSPVGQSREEDKDQELILHGIAQFKVWALNFEFRLLGALWTCCWRYDCVVLKCSVFI